MTESLTFAHLTDIHLATRGDSWGSLGSLAGALFAAAVDELNALDDLAFVLITGDVIERGIPPEIERFHALIAPLKCPWHFVPGNHDGYVDPESPDTLPPHEAVARIDPRLADPVPYPRRAYWHRAVGRGIHLIGLDSRVGDDWYGRVGPAQIGWLDETLAAHAADLAIVAAHHPLHRLTALSEQPWWSNFICEDGAEVEAVLDRHPNARLVLSGHHHVNQLRRRGGRLHVHTAALSGYPCAYRVVRVAPEGSGWRVRVETRSPADAGQLKRALDQLLDSDITYRYEPENLTAWAEFAAGGPDDLTFDGVLGSG
jgi:Icc protein